MQMYVQQRTIHSVNKEWNIISCVAVIPLALLPHIQIRILDVILPNIAFYRHVSSEFDRELQES